MFNNQMPNNPFQYNNQAGTTYMPNQVAFTQPLSQEDVDSLRKNDKLFTLKVDKTELDRSICTHKYPGTNNYSTDQTNDGTGDLVCRICGARFNPDSITPEKVTETVKDMDNILQTCKLLYVNIPPAVARQYFAMIPFINKLPMMYKVSLENFQRNNPQAFNNVGQVNPANNLLNAFKSVIGGGYGYGYDPYGQQNMNGYNPNMGMGIGQPNIYNPQMNPQQPNMNPQYPYGQQNMNGYNPNMGMAMNQPMQNSQYAYTPTPQDNPFFANGSMPVQQPNMNMNQPQQQMPTQPAPVQPQPQRQATTPQGQAIERVNASATLDA